MRGLIKKDIYMILKTCRSYVLLIVTFSLAAAVAKHSMFFLTYPCLVSGIIPLNILLCEEKDGWIRYAAACPYSRRLIVAEKYLLCVLVVAVVSFAEMLMQVVYIAATGSAPVLSVAGIPLWFFFTTAVGVVMSAVSMPFAFGFGANRGQIWSKVMLGVFFGTIAAFSGMFLGENSVKQGVMKATSIIAPVLYVLSWMLALKLYRKREL